MFRIPQRSVAERRKDLPSRSLTLIPIFPPKLPNQESLLSHRNPRPVSKRENSYFVKRNRSNPRLFLHRQLFSLPEYDASMEYASGSRGGHRHRTNENE